MNNNNNNNTEDYIDISHNDTVDHGKLLEVSLKTNYNLSVSLSQNNELTLAIQNLSENIKNTSYTSSSSLSSSTSSLLSSTTSLSTPPTSLLTPTIYPSLSSSTTYFTSKDVVLGKDNKNWLVPYKTFVAACFACSYFGHGYKECPNIKKIDDACLNCWNPGHVSSKCKNYKVAPPFLEDYIKPDELLARMLNL